MKRKILILTLLLLSFSLFNCKQKHSIYNIFTESDIIVGLHHNFAVTLTKDVKIKKSTNLSSITLSNLKKGDYLIIIEKLPATINIEGNNYNWHKVTDLRGNVGYVTSKDLFFVNNLFQKEWQCNVNENLKVFLRFQKENVIKVFQIEYKNGKKVKRIAYSRWFIIQKGKIILIPSKYRNKGKFVLISIQFANMKLMSTPSVNTFKARFRLAFTLNEKDCVFFPIKRN